VNAFLDLEIRERVANYLQGKSTLAQFEDWFVPVAMSVEEATNPSAAELAYTIELYLAEYSSGHRTEAELADLLRREVTTYSRQLTIPADLAKDRPGLATASSSVTVGAAGSSSFAGIRGVAVSA
jgi:hypothetical protein